MRKTIHGAVSIAKTSMSVYRVSKQDREDRLKVCSGCEHKHHLFNNTTLVAYCTQCGGCSIRFKSMLIDEDCPENKWNKSFC